jgi:integrase
MRLYPRKNSNGERVWWASWTENGSTRRKSTGKSTKDAAQLVIARWERRLADPALAAASEATLGLEAAEFLKSCRARAARREKMGIKAKDTLAAGSLDMYEQKVGLLVNLLGRALRGILKQAKHGGRFPADISAIKPLHFSGASAPKTTRLTWEQIPRLLAELSKERADVVRFILATGARAAEWRRAQDGDVADGTVRLRGTKTKKSERTIPVPGPLAHLLDGVQLPLKPWRTAYAALEAACRRASVCSTCRSTPTGKRGPRTAKKPKEGCLACAAATVPKVTFNDLRRTFSTLLAEAHVTPEVRAQLMGHASTAMTLGVYTHVDAAGLKTLLDAQTNVRREPPVNQDRSKRWTPRSRWKRRLRRVALKKAEKNAVLLVGQDRLELSANGLRVRCSTN